MTDPEPQQPDALRVDLDVLERRGIASLDLDVLLPVDWLAMALSKTDATVERAGRVSLSVYVQPDGTVLVRGKLVAGFDVPCARCIAPAPVAAEEELTVTFVPASHERARRVAAFDDDPDGVTLEEEDLDLYTYRGRILALEGMVAEHVSLAYPMRALCGRGEACRGLCTGCGADLNELGPADEACAGCGLPLYQVSHAPADRARAPQKKEDSPWQAALRKLRDDEGKPS